MLTKDWCLCLKYSPATNNIADDNIRSATEKYLGIGESIFDMLQGTAVTSSYFKRDQR